jgi:hypothetical protein
MFFFTLLAVVAPMVAMAKMSGRGRGAGRGGRGARGGPRMAGRAAGGAARGIQGVDAEYLCETTGLIKSWRAASQEDTDILRQAIEAGYLDGYQVKDVKDEYPRYNRFTNKCLGDKISNLRRTLRDNIEHREQMDYSGGGGQQMPAFNTHHGASPARSNGHNTDEGEEEEEYYDADFADGMSRLSVQDDEYSFADQSQAFRSVAFRGSSARSAASGRQSAAAGGGASASGRPAGILRNANGTPPTRRRSSGGSTTRSTSSLMGGEICQYTISKWMDSTPRKRYSIE